MRNKIVKTVKKAQMHKTCCVEANLCTNGPTEKEKTTKTREKGDERQSTNVQMG